MVSTASTSTPTKSPTGPAFHKALVSLGVPHIQKVVRNRKTGYHVIDFQKKKFDGKPDDNFDKSFEVWPVQRYATIITMQFPQAQIITKSESITHWRDQSQQVRYGAHLVLNLQPNGVGGKATHPPPQIKANGGNLNLNGHGSALPAKKNPKPDHNNISAATKAAQNSKESTLSPFVTADYNTPNIILRKNIQTNSGKIEPGTIVPKFTVGDKVWLNGYGDCKIKTNPGFYIGHFFFNVSEARLVGSIKMLL